MDLESYVDLYLAETQDNLRRLSRALLELEVAGAEVSALDEAFRAAHTIKGAAALMGYGEVAALAHELEDRLDAVRRSGGSRDPGVIDELLACVDRLEAANDAAVAGGARGGAVLLVRVEFTEDCLLKAARAAVIARNVGSRARVLGMVPAAPKEDFEGSLQLFVELPADREALESAIRGAGDVAAVEFEEVRGIDLTAAIAASGAEAEGGGGPAVPAVGERPREGAGERGRRLIRIAADHLDELAEGIADLAILTRQLEGLADRNGAGDLAEVVSAVRRRVRGLEATAQLARLIPVGEAFHRLPRLVRDTASGLGKQVDFQLEGEGIEADRRVLEEAVEPLVHLLRNAVDHGLESPDEREAAGKPRRGRLVLRAMRERAGIRIELEDDGRGIDWEGVAERARALGLSVGEGSPGGDELLRVLSHPGLSTAGEVTGVSGRGVGLDAVVSRVRALGGALGVRTTPGRGTTFVMRLPASLTELAALWVRVGGEDYAIPLTHVREVAELEPDAVATGREWFELRGEVLRLTRLADVLEVSEPGQGVGVVVVEAGERIRGLVVDEFVGREQIVVKGFAAPEGVLPCFSGATLLADGRPALVLDPVSVL